MALDCSVAPLLGAGWPLVPRRHSSSLRGPLGRGNPCAAPRAVGLEPKIRWRPRQVGEPRAPRTGARRPHLFEHFLGENRTPGYDAARGGDRHRLCVGNGRVLPGFEAAFAPGTGAANVMGRKGGKQGPKGRQAGLTGPAQGGGETRAEDPRGESGPGSGGERVLSLAQVLEKSGFLEDFCLDSASPGFAPASLGFAPVSPGFASVSAGFAIISTCLDCSSPRERVAMRSARRQKTAAAFRGLSP